MAARRVVPSMSICTADLLQLRLQQQQTKKLLLLRSNLWNGSSSWRGGSSSSSSCKQQGMQLRPVQASVSESSPAKHQETPNALPLPEQQEWVSRTQLCGALTDANEGERVRICGWVASHRSHGNLTFVNLRDHTGIVQVATDPRSFSEAHLAAERVRMEYVIAIEGTVRRRPNEGFNQKMSTGSIEVLAESVQLLNAVRRALPFAIATADESKVAISEEVRLRYRHVDLRRTQMSKNLRLRHSIIKLIRRYLEDRLQFVEIETPILTRSTPEGARDYLVPSRVQAGSIPLVPVSVEITYDLERILTSLQEDEGSEGRAGKVLSLQPHDLEAFDNEGISSEVTCRRRSELADSVRGSTLPRSNVGRAEEQAKVEELAKVVEIMRQSLVSVLEQLEALVRQKEITDGSSKSIHVREVMSDSAIASALTAVETIGSSLNGIRIECEDLKSSRSLMEFRKSVQQKEAKRSLNHNVGLRKQNLKPTEDTAAINGIRKEDEKFMGEALVEAKKAALAGEVPVGAVIVQKGKIIARAYNRVESDADPTAHAEMLCLRSAARQHGDWRLMDATVYVTLEPCPMCAGAILQSRVRRLVWGSRNTLLGADGSWVSLFPELVEEEMDSECQRSENGPGNGPSIHPFHTSLEVRRQVLADECSTVMRSFFKARRTLKIHFLKTKPWWLPLSAWVLFKRMVSWWSSLVKE